MHYKVLMEFARFKDRFSRWFTLTILNTFTRIHKYGFIVMSLGIRPCNISRANSRTRTSERADCNCFSHLHGGLSAGEHPSACHLLLATSAPAKAQTGKRQRGREKMIEGHGRISACASGGRPHVAYVYFLQLTLRDSSGATRPSLTTAVFTIMMTTTKRTSHGEPHEHELPNALDWLAWIKINQPLHLSSPADRLFLREIFTEYLKTTFGTQKIFLRFFFLSHKDTLNDFLTGFSLEKYVEKIFLYIRDSSREQYCKFNKNSTGMLTKISYFTINILFVVALQSVRMQIRSFWKIDCTPVNKKR